MSISPSPTPNGQQSESPLFFEDTLFRDITTFGRDIRTVVSFHQSLHPTSWAICSFRIAYPLGRLRQRYLRSQFRPSICTPPTSIQEKDSLICLPQLYVIERPHCPRHPVTGANPKAKPAYYILLSCITVVSHLQHPSAYSEYHFSREANRSAGHHSCHETYLLFCRDPTFSSNSNLLTLHASTEDDPPQEERKEGNSVLSDGLRCLRNRYMPPLAPPYQYSFTRTQRHVRHALYRTAKHCTPTDSSLYSKNKTRIHPPCRANIYLSSTGRTTFVNTLCGKTVLAHKDSDDASAAHVEDGVKIKPLTVGM